MKQFFDKLGKVLGSTQEASGQKFVYNNIGSQVGRYDPKSDITYDPIGRVYGYGDHSTALMHEFKK